MPISLTNQRENRSWTFKEWVQGKPIGHPSHPMFVHFPIAFYLATLVFDVMTRIEPNAGLVQAGTYLLIGAAAATVILVITGLTDWFGMVRGSSKRRLATQHLLVQFTSAVFFQITLLLRLSNRTQPQAETLWIILEVIGYLIIIVGQYLGGVLVYEKGMRVSTGGAAREPDERPASA
ncbi:MAG: DUF2231 domain-containing protein [Actinomycetota bacterium]|nr:DUF2231 domain-containing protein [Actinomycetota bacterium]